MSNPNKVVKVLLEKGVNPNRTTRENRSPPLVLAAEKENYDVMALLLDIGSAKFDVNQKDRNGNTALHLVAKNRNLDKVVRLLNSGARLDVKNNLGQEPISTAALKDLMDMSLEADEDETAHEDEYKVKLRFGLFVQRKHAVTSAETQMGEEGVPLNGPAQVSNTASESARLVYITENYSDDCIQQHPLLATFVQLKWPSISRIYYANLVYVTMFAVLLSIFIATDSDNKRLRSNILAMILMVLITIFWSGLVLRELVQLLQDFRKYISSVDNLLGVALIVCTASSVFITWHSEDVRITFSVLSLLLSWWRFFVVSGKTPDLAAHMVVFKMVTKTSVLFLVWYSTLLLPFALCFYLLMRNSDQNYSTFGLCLFSFFTMSIFKVDPRMFEYSPAPFLCYCVLLGFICFVAILLLNFLHALRVSSIQEIKESVSLRSFRSRVRLIRDVEDSLVTLHKLRIPLVARMFPVSKMFQYDDSVYMYPNYNSSVVVGGRTLSVDRNVVSEVVKIINARSEGCKGDKHMTEKSREVEQE